MIEEILHRPHIRSDGVLGKISLCQMIFEFCYHITLIYNKYSNNIAKRIGHYQNLPVGWAMCKLSNLCRIENGFAFSSNDYKPQGIPLVRISNIIHNTIDTTNCAYIEGITDNKFKISKGDLLIAMSGATTGKMGVYPFDETAYLNQRVGNIKILNKSSLSPDYRNTYMRSKVDEILKIAYGGAQPNISASVIGNFDFPLPPYKEQIRIVETVQRIFDQLDVITESL